MKTVIKSGWILCLFTLFLTKSMAAVPPETEISVRGAANKSALTEVVFQAIKNNDFETIMNYLPDEHHLEILRNNTNAVDKVFYEELTDESLKDHAQANFERVIKEGIDREINWSSLELVDYSAKENRSLKNIHTTIILMQDNREVPLSLTFDSIEIQNRWFIIQGIRPEMVSQVGLID